jgi:hypothetical protein
MVYGREDWHQSCEWELWSLKGQFCKWGEKRIKVLAERKNGEYSLGGME